jgi:hypothetical protein
MVSGTWFGVSTSVGEEVHLYITINGRHKRASWVANVLYPLPILPKLLRCSFRV